VSTLADLLNAPTEFVHKGVTFKLRQPTLVEQGMYQRWLEERARAAAGRATDLPEDRQRQLLKDVNDATAVGEYEWGGEVCARAVRTPTGLAKLLSIVLADQAVTFEVAQDMVAEKLREIAAALMSRATDDPKALAAALRTLGLPSASSSSSSPTRRSTKRSKRSRG
jgi:hypothetical protein